MKKLIQSAWLALGAAVLIAGCGGGGGGGGTAVQASAVVVWNDAILETIKEVKPGPPATARAIGILHTAIYDAWSAYTPTANPVASADSIRRPAFEHTLANKRKAASFAAYHALSYLFPTQTARYAAVMTSLGYDPNEVPLTPGSPVEIGTQCAVNLHAVRVNDGSNQANNYADTSGYVPVNTPDNVVDPSKWQVLRFTNGATPGYVLPHWGTVQPFSLNSASDLRPEEPPVFGSETYIDEMRSVMDYTAGLTDEQKVIAEYWAGGPGTTQPPGYWCEFAQFISERDRHSFDDDVKMFFLVGNALMDAGITCWEAKRHWNTSRPITAIRHFFAGQPIRGWGGPGLNNVEIQGENWIPFQPGTFITPPFAEYVSGHSTFSSAAAEVLKRFKGSDGFGHSVTIPARSLTTEPTSPATSVTLSWATFSDAANQAGISRIYGGIHFESGNLAGQGLGRGVGQAVWEKAQTYFNGS